MNRRFLLTRAIPAAAALTAVTVAPRGGSTALARWTRGLASDSQTYPTAGWQESTSRPLPAVEPPRHTGAPYLFERLNTDGMPVSFDPYRPIHYVIRSVPGTPTRGQEMIQQAFAALSGATGLQFICDGSTREAPSAARPAYQPSTYGNRWAPVLVAWTDPRESPGLAGDVIALTSSVAFTSGKHHGRESFSYVSGQILLDTPQLDNDLSNGLPAMVRAVLQHELGHLVGLAHVKDDSQLMFHEMHPEVTTYQSGDLRGLALLGQGPPDPRS